MYSARKARSSAQIARKVLGVTETLTSETWLFTVRMEGMLGPSERAVRAANSESVVVRRRAAGCWSVTVCLLTCAGFASAHVLGFACACAPSTKASTRDAKKDERKPPA